MAAWLHFLKYRWITNTIFLQPWVCLDIYCTAHNVFMNNISLLRSFNGCLKSSGKCLKSPEIKTKFECHSKFFVAQINPSPATKLIHKYQLDMKKLARVELRVCLQNVFSLVYPVRVYIVCVNYCGVAKDTEPFVSISRIYGAV